MFTKGKWYVTEDYYGGIRISTVPTNATNIVGEGSIFENTGRGAGDMEEADAKRIVQCVNSHDELVEALESFITLIEEIESISDDEAAMRQNWINMINTYGKAKQALRRQVIGT